MATIRKSKSSKGYRYHVQIRLAGYPNQSKTFSNINEAKRWSILTEDKLRKGYYESTDEAGTLTLRNILDRYIEEVLPLKKSKQPVISSSRIINAHLGEYSLLNLSRSVCSSYRDTRLQSVSSSTVKKEISLLSRVINVAIKDWNIFLPYGNPINSICKPKESKARSRRLENDELSLLLNSSPELMKNVITLLIETGIRRGELCKITINNINFDDKTLILIDTKNGDNREIPLTQNAISALNQLITLNPSCNTNIIPIVSVHPDCLSHNFHRICVNLNITNLRLHDLRHEATSIFFEKYGLNIMEVSAITGHKDLKMLKRYTHLKATNLLQKIEASS